CARVYASYWYFDVW
nr:immunoglobulin heavy chain junction region [Mus musculus]